jgi:uncharacterized protein YrzB (UPF0473 family)
MDEEIIVFTDEDGNETNWTIAQVIKVDEKDYAILLPHGAVNTASVDPIEFDEAVILRIDEDGDEDVLVEIEDEEEFERVAEAWECLLGECEEED